LTSVRDGVAYHAAALLTLGAARTARSRARVTRGVVGTVLRGLRQSFGEATRTEAGSGS
jgi:hypothetical protein